MTRRVADTGVRVVMMAAVTAGCGGSPKTAVTRVNPAECQPLARESLTGFSLRDEAPRLRGGWPYRCVVFVADSGKRAELTVFAADFRPEVYLLDPASGPTLLAWSRTGPGDHVARVTTTLRRTATYAAVVTTVARGEGGSFLLTIHDGH